MSHDFHQLKKSDWLKTLADAHFNQTDASIFVCFEDSLGNNFREETQLIWNAIV